MLERIVDGLIEKREKLTFTLNSRSGMSRRQPHASDGINTTPAAKSREISFPGSTAQEAWNFS
jgi:meiotic recombination protein SPO11